MQEEHAAEAKESKDGLAQAKVLLKDLIETLRPMFGEWQKSEFTWLLWLLSTQRMLMD